MAGGGVGRWWRENLDESPEEAARRELHEETGLSVSLSNLIPVSDDGRTRVFLCPMPSLSWRVVSERFARRSDRREVDAVWWGSWLDARGPEIFANDQQHIDNIRFLLDTDALLPH